LKADREGLKRQKADDLAVSLWGEGYAVVEYGRCDTMERAAGSMAGGVRLDENKAKK